MAEELFSGWAPDAPIDDSLLRQFVFSMADRASFLSERLGAPLARDHTVAAVDPASGVIFDNYAVLLQPPTMLDLDQAVEQVMRFFPPERSFVFMSAWPVGDLSGHGLRLMGHPPFMIRPPGGADVRDTGLRVVEVDTDARLGTFTDTIIEAYPMPGGGTTVFDRRILGDSIRLFVGYEGDRPVATAGAVVSHGIVDVEWVSVMPDCRGKGYGEAITWAATLAAPDSPAVLIASDDGFPVYRRMGYLPLVRLTLWYHGSI